MQQEAGVGSSAGEVGFSTFGRMVYLWCQNVCASVCEHCREAAAQPTVARAGVALLHHHLCPGVSGEEGHYVQLHGYFRRQK